MRFVSLTASYEDLVARSVPTRGTGAATLGATDAGRYPIGPNCGRPPMPSISDPAACQQCGELPSPREISWKAFSHMLMSFEGWQFKLECFDRSETV
jgi:hypothetical protein